MPAPVRTLTEISFIYVFKIENSFSTVSYIKLNFALVLVTFPPEPALLLHTMVSSVQPSPEQTSADLQLLFEIEIFC